MHNKHWLHWLMLALGGWLFAAPLWMGAAYLSAQGPAAWNAFMLGALVAVVAIWALIRPRPWEEWLEIRQQGHALCST